jgi:hypothetical protein
MGEVERAIGFDVIVTNGIIVRCAPLSFPSVYQLACHFGEGSELL